MSANADGAGDCWVEKIGKPAYESIAEMVAAMQVDRGRLEELRDERDGYEAADGEPAKWEDANPDEAEELAELEAAVKIDGEEVSEDEARERIQEDPLSIRVFGERVDGEWEATSYEVLLATGGPAVRIVGDLDGNEPSSARLQVQDWYKPWTEYFDVERGTLLDYVSCHYFGD